MSNPPKHRTRALVEPLLDELRDVRTLDDLQRHINELRDNLSVDHVVYHSVNSTGKQYAALTYGDEWVQRYLDKDYQRIDPVVQGCYRRFVAVDWKDLDWSGKQQRNFLGEAVDGGVGNQGYSVPVRGPSGQFALFTVSHTATDSDWRAYTKENLRALVLAAHFVNQKALEIERGTDVVDLKSLSPRERDTLRLLALGYSRAQASDQLMISEHTLRVYLESARYKLGAANTTHAVALALVSGLILV